MNRIAKWDNAKFVLIILVVICHFYENYLGSSKLVNSLFFSVYTFHMPAFFLISGMFSKKTVKERKIVKVVPYLLVYLFMKMFGYFVSGIMMEEHLYRLISSGNRVPLGLFLRYFSCI